MPIGQEACQLIGVALFVFEDALQHAAGGRVAVAELSDRGPVGVYGVALGLEIGHQHPDQAVARPPVEARQRLDAAGPKGGIAAELTDPLGEGPSVAELLLGVGFKLLHRRPRPQSLGLESVLQIPQVAQKLGGQQRLEPTHHRLGLERIAWRQRAAPHVSAADSAPPQAPPPDVVVARALRQARANTAPSSQRRAEALQWQLAQLGRRVVPFEIRRLGSAPVRREDLQQEALLGLYDAAGRFDPDRGARFTTFAHWHVRHRLQVLAARVGPVVAQPVSAHRARARIRRAEHTLRQAGERGTVARIAELTDLTPRRVAELRRPIRGHDYDGPVGDDGGRTWAECLPADTVDPAAQLDTKRAVRRLRLALRPSAGALSEREHHILTERYLSPRATAPARRVLGQQLGISGERVRQLERRALKRLHAAVAH